MTFIEKLQCLERLHQLIKLRATGTPDNLARRLGVSKRTCQRIINQMREFGLPVQYDHCDQSYYYAEEVKYTFELFINGDLAIKLKGGIGVHRQFLSRSILRLHHY